MMIQNRKTTAAAAITLLLTVCCLLSACTSYIRLENTPEHCYEGTDIETLDYICDHVPAGYSKTEGRYFTYSTSNVMSTYFQYTGYLSDRGYDAYISGLKMSAYETEFGYVTVEITSELLGNVTHVSGTIKVTIDR